MGAKSTTKGAALERRIAVFLSQWVSGTARRDIFWRSSQSGGRSTRHAKRTGAGLKSGAGDISAVDAAGQPFIDRFVVEVKHRRELHFTQLLTGVGKRGILEFWEQVNHDARSVGKHPLLLVKQDRLPVMAGISITLLQHVQAVTGGRPATHSLFPAADLCLSPLEEFFAVLKPGDLERIGSPDALGSQPLLGSTPPGSGRPAPKDPASGTTRTARPRKRRRPAA